LDQVALHQTLAQRVVLAQRALLACLDLQPILAQRVQRGTRDGRVERVPPAQ
jgi:hypothetical protein